MEGAMGNENSPVNDNSNVKTRAKARVISVNVVKSQTKDISKDNAENKVETVEAQRHRIHQKQTNAIEQLSKTVFPIETIRQNLLEWQRFKVVKDLDKRGLNEVDELYTAFDHLYLIDDILQQVLPNLHQHDCFGWKLNSASTNKLSLDVVGNQINNNLAESFKSAAAYTLAHFGSSSYLKDSSIFIGNIAGYLFVSYFCAHLKISYSVTSLPQSVLPDASYQTPTIVTNTQQVQSLPLQTKKQIYQLAVLCANISVHAINKVIETMLIADVNDFDKKKEQEVLKNMMRYGG